MSKFWSWTRSALDGGVFHLKQLTELARDWKSVPLNKAAILCFHFQ